MLPFQEGVPSPLAAPPQAGALTPCYPQHCLLGWDILPPKSEKSSAPKSLDLWSCVSKAQHRKLSAAATSHLVQPRVPWEGQVPGASRGLQGPWRAGLGWECQVWKPLSVGSRPTLAPTPVTSLGSTAPHWLYPPILEGDPKSEIQKRVRLEMG